MAYSTSITGGISELTAARALMSVGYEVSKPIVPEVYDLLIRDPNNGRTYTVQVKTMFVREDRNNALVVYTRKGDGKPYGSEVDYFVAVYGDKAYLFENTHQGEYWATEASASKRWIELTAVNEINEESNEAEAV